jgi:hypothetical protein
LNEREREREERREREREGKSGGSYKRRRGVTADNVYI